MVDVYITAYVNVCCQVQHHSYEEIDRLMQAMQHACLRLGNSFRHKLFNLCPIRQMVLVDLLVVAILKMYNGDMRANVSKLMNESVLISS